MQRSWTEVDIERLRQQAHDRLIEMEFSDMDRQPKTWWERPLVYTICGLIVVAFWLLVAWAAF